MKTSAILGLGLLLATAAPAQTGELFGGVYAHDVKTGITRSGFEDGVDFQLGWRGPRIRALDAIRAPSPHAFVSVNSAGATKFASAGISWKIGDSIYARPGIGLAVHDGPDDFDPRGERIYFGSRILFAPEIGVGAKLNERASVEASWVHLSHGQLFSHENPGIDNFGLRLNYRFR